MKYPFKLIPFLLILIAVPTANAFPICVFTSYPEFTLAEELEDADVVALVEWVSSNKGAEDEQTNFRVKRVAKGNALKRGQSQTMPGLYKGKPGDLFLLLGTKEKDGDISWALQNSSVAAFQYAVKAPSTKLAVAKRLAYYTVFLEHADESVARDAYREFTNAEITAYRAIAMSLPKEKLLESVLDEQKKAGRRHIYGLLLGACGDEKTAVALKANNSRGRFSSPSWHGWHHVRLPHAGRRRRTRSA